MNNKYLPIGTIVKVKAIDKQIMIIGYYSIEYQNSVKIYDYVGCVYPEGMLLKNNTYSFNHSDIEKIDFTGYKNEKYDILNNNLNGQISTEPINSDKQFVNFKFDENGVVVYEEYNNSNNTPVVEDVLNIKNPFEYTKSKPSSSVEPKIDSNFKFDENGIVLEDTVAKDNLKNIQNNLDFAIKNNWQTSNEDIKYQFDENGNVVTEENNDKQYQFDENGFVINDVSVKDNKPKEQYKFDENGVVINDANVKDDNQKQQFQFDENGFVIDDNNKNKKENVEYKFNSDGMVVSD